MNNLEVKIAKLEEKVDNIENTVNRMDNKLDQMNNNYVTYKDLGIRDRQIKELKDNNTWLWRTVVGAILLALVTFIMKGGLTHVTVP